MLEGIVANLLNRFLGMYVKNFDAGQLNVGIWSGDVKLRNLQLRREALDQLHLPINVVEGHLGELTLSIPWSNLRGKPVKVDIQDVFLLAAPKEDSSYDPEEERRRDHAIKMEKLESAELLKDRSSEGMSHEDQLKNQSFMESLATAIVDNLQVVIKNVHFRYEDAVAVPEHPFAVGCTIKELSAVSTDADWRPTFIQSVSGTAHKLATLNSLAVYWNTDAELFGKGSAQDGDLDMSHEELMDRLRDYIEAGEKSQHILKPVSGKAGLELDKTGSIEKPRIKARLLFDELGFVLDDHQYRDALMLVDLFHYFIRNREYKSLQPKCSVKEDPRAWFRFAGNAILSKIHERNRRWTWDFMKERRDDRIQYIALFKKQKREEPLSPDEKWDLQRLEEKLSYEDLRFWRSLARNQLRKENIGVPKVAKQQTWSEWIWGSKKPEESATTMTEEQRKELYDVIDWDEKKAISESIDLPKETIKFQVESSLRTGSFTLKRDPHDKGNHVLKLVFDNFKAKALQRPDSFMAQVDLGGLRLFDRTVEGTKFPQIIRVKDAKGDDEEEHFSEAPEVPDLEAPEEEEETEGDDAEDSLFHLQFEKNPLDGSADSALKVKLKSIEVIYNPLVAVEVVNFFRPPERHMESIGALLETAGATVEEIRQQTRAGLEFALEEHKTIDAKLDIHAPLFIIPESITAESSMCLIVDAGRVGVTSKLVDKKHIKLIQDKQGREYNEHDYKQLEDLMYDRFLLKLDSTQVLIGPDIESTRAQLDPKSPSRNFHIIDRINVDFVLELCIVPQSTDLTRTRLSGHLPELHASMSDMKYKNLMRLIDIAIPRFGDQEDIPQETAPAPASKEAKEHDTRARSQSLQLARVEAPVLDEDSDTEEDRPSTVTKSKTKPVNPRQRVFEFKFTVDRLRGSLFRSNQDDARTDTLLVELVAEHFQLDYYLRAYDMVAEIVLKSLSVDDHIEEQPAPEFKQIVSSKGFDATEDKDLFNLRFVKVNLTSPEFVSKYEGIEMNLDLSVSTINLIVTRKTLLTLLDFILITFTNPNQPKQQQPRGSTAPALKDSAEKDSTPGAGKIRIKSKLESIALILNDDGTRLATLSLNTADVGIFLADETMRVQGRMGSLTLFDDMSQKGPRSTVRRLMSIEGEDFADFRYQTFNPLHKDYPGYNSEVFLRSGSVKINFIEDPYRKIVNFLVRFGKMQSIFNAARQAAANQASQIQENAPLMRFDVVVSTPILVFPRITADDKPSDFITAHLGEIYANNRFSKLDDSEGSPNLNLINAGMRHIRLTSHFYYEEDHSEELEMIEKVDLDFSIGYLQDKRDRSTPNLQVEGTMSPINLRISQTQCKFLLELSKTVPAALIPDQELQQAEAVQSIPNSTLDLAQPATPHGGTPRPSYQAPELGPEEEASVQLDFSFKVETIGLELILAENSHPVGSLEEASLSKFFLSDTNVKLRMMTDGALESELLVQSFNVRDSRAKEINRFRKIMSLVNTSVQQQFMASISMSGGEDRQLIAMLTIDSPRIIFALDYLFALKSFAQTAFSTDEPATTSDASSERSGTESPSESSEASSAVLPQERTSGTENGRKITTSMRVNVVDAQVILVANPTIASSEAIVLGSKQLLYSQQNASTLQISKVGMFLCRMDKFQNSRLRILDDFTIEASMDNRTIARNCSSTRVEVHVDPLVLRLSLRDILLAIQIMNKASEMMNAGNKGEAEQRKSSVGGKDVSAKSSARKKSRAQQPSAATDTTALIKQTPSTLVQQSAIMQKEEMSIHVDGIRVILIGDVYVLPLLDWRVNKFSIVIRDWSSEMSGDTAFDTFINVYNFSKSAWEPLIEPYQLGFHMAKELSPDVLSIEAFSHKNLELTVTSATIALASKSLQFFSTDQDVISKPRGSDAPYRIRNYTGFELRVWAEPGNGEEGPAELLSDGQEFPWRFEDATTMRENLAPEGAAGLVGIKLEGSGFDSINKIPFIREGETLYNLKPKKDRVLHRLLVEVRLGPDYIKYITFRSPLMIENNTCLLYTSDAADDN